MGALGVHVDERVERDRVNSVSGSHSTRHKSFCAGDIAVDTLGMAVQCRVQRCRRLPDEIRMLCYDRVVQAGGLRRCAGGNLGLWWKGHKGREICVSQRAHQTERLQSLGVSSDECIKIK